MNDSPQEKDEKLEAFRGRIHDLFNENSPLSAEAISRLAYYEIKTPLAAIEGFAKYVRDKSSPDVRAVVVAGTPEKGMNVRDLVELTLDQTQRINIVVTEMLKAAMAQRSAAPTPPGESVGDQNRPT